ncbi:MAG: IS4 family transposase [Planctomycetaceae bacterium]|nr:IS4 family transposase [Planctomycetaceae bacterium]MCB9950470.1 IS4 family transposase [Planctomycetaceae bacterium]
MSIDVPRQGHRKARQAHVTLRFAPLRMPPPSRGNDWIKEHAPQEPILMWVVELKEAHPPQDAEALHWVLLTSEVIDSLSAAQACLNSYKLRWGVEEYHKVLKTGCRVEKRYYETADRLERVTGLLSVLAVRLLQIRSLANDTPNQLAQEVVPIPWVKTLAAVRKRSADDMTIAQFTQLLAGLGGHLGRKHDGRPGWITLWRGLEKLLLILRGASLRT